VPSGVLEVATPPFDDVADEGVVMADESATQSRQTPSKGRAQLIQRIYRCRSLAVRNG